METTPERSCTGSSREKMKRDAARLLLNTAPPPSCVTAETTRSRLMQDSSSLAAVAVKAASAVLGEERASVPSPLARFYTAREKYDAARRRMAESRMKMISSRFVSTSGKAPKLGADAIDATPAPNKRSKPPEEFYSMIMQYNAAVKERDAARTRLDEAKMSAMHTRMLMTPRGGHGAPVPTQPPHIMKVTLTKASPIDKDVTTEVTFSTVVERERNNGGNVLKDGISQACDSLEKNIVEFERTSSWSTTAQRAIVLQLATLRQEDKADDSAHVRPDSGHTLLPVYIQNKRAVLSIMCTDEKSFLWCILAARHPVLSSKTPQRLNHYEAREKEVIGLTFPMTLSQIPQFESVNEVSVNVLAYMGEQLVVPVFVTTQRYGFTSTYCSSQMRLVGITSLSCVA
jgi:hypothetical protein